MSERTEYAPGTPSWADNASADPAAAAAFYAALFGWETEDAMPADADGEYHMASLRGKAVAAFGPQPMEGVPPVWNTYITVESADATAAATVEAGGAVLADPFDVMEAGRMAVLADPAGAVFCVWEPRQHIGAQIVNEPDSMTWNELLTSDVGGARQFYGTVFGWQTSAMEGGPGEYFVWHAAGVEPNQGTADDPGNGLGGLMANDQMPPGTPPFWMVYFAVVDADKAAARAEELGGSVSAPPFDVPGVGRIAVLTDGNGAAFSVIAPAA